MPEIRASDIMCLSLLVFTQLLSEVATREVSASQTGAKTEFDAKWPVKVIQALQGHIFWGQWKGEKGLSNII